MSARMVSKRQLVGRRIVGLEVATWQSQKGLAHNPRILLDDGSSLYFVVEETGAEYGIFIGKTNATRKRGKP